MSLINHFKGIRWVMDCEGDIGLTFWNIVTFLKYKHSVILVWFEWMPDAPKYLMEPKP